MATRLADAPRRWQNKIVRVEEVDPLSLLANPANWRIHPKNQSLALDGTLKDVGWIAPITVNERSGFVVDGHLRVALALQHNEPMIPVAFVDLSPAEEAEALASFDPLAAMAYADAEQLRALLDEVSTADTAVMQMLADLAEANGLGAGVEPPEDFASYDEDIATEHQCPKCGYQWSGQSS